MHEYLPEVTEIWIIPELVSENLLWSVDQHLDKHFSCFIHWGGGPAIESTVVLSKFWVITIRDIVIYYKTILPVSYTHLTLPTIYSV